MSVKILREADSTIPSEVLEFAKKIDFDDLSNLVSKHVNAGSSIKLVPGEIRKGYSGYYIPAESEDVRDKCGIMSEVFDSVVIDLFNSSITTDKNTGELYFWCTPHFSYHLKEGGSNGVEICTAIFTERNGWVIR